MIEASHARERAMAFLMAESDGLARSCALVVGGGEKPAEALARLVESERVAEQPAQWQRIFETLDDIGALGSGLAARVCARLSSQQRENGSWSGVEPTSEAGEIFCTGMIAGYLAKTRFVRQRALELAADHLATLWNPDRVKGDAWESTAAYFHCFSLIRHESADAILQWCGRELQRGLVTGVYDAVRTTRVFVWCRAHALPGASLRRDELLERLVGEQCADGGFRRSDGDSVPARVAHTLDALVGLVYLG
ncbi:MAG: hypothetical protein AAEJ52_00360 [Myxococcota bacterium]